MKVHSVKFRHALLALSLMSTASYADGMVSLKDTPAPVGPSWSGPYFGVSAGGGWNDSENNYHDSDGESSSVDEDADGGLVSAIWGIDWMIRDNLVVGGFVDYDLSDIERGDGDNRLTIDRAWSIGGRLGYLVTPTTMVFATAGYTRAHFDNEGWWDIVNGGTTLPGADSKWFDGWFVGGGFEHALRNNFYLRGEVRWADYDSEVTNSGTFLGTTFVDSEDPELVTARLGVVYKLGRDHPLFHRGHAAPSDTIKVISYTGVDVAKDIWSVYAGSLFALNGDFERDGFIVRTFGYHSDFEYSDRDIPITNFDGKDRSVDAMIGYQKYFGTTSVIGYIGYEVRDIDIDPFDPENDVQGTEDGFKVAVEIETGDDNPFYGALDGSYSTAFDSWFGMLRLGPNAKWIKYGPEGMIFSDEGEVTWRVGAFAMLPFDIRDNLPAEFSVNAGYQGVEDDDNNGGVDGQGSAHGGEGAYGGAMLKLLF